MSIGRLSAPLALTALALALTQVAAADGSQGPFRYTTRPTQTTALPDLTQPDSLLTVGRNRLLINKSGAQSETAIAVDPTNSQHIIASSNDLGNFNTFNNVVESTNGGRTWVSAGVNVNTFCYDPWLDFNANGDAFFSYECGDERIAYRLAGTNNWVHTTLQNSSLGPDRDMVVTDDTASSPFFGSVYIGYDEAGQGNAAHVWFSRTGTGGWTKSPKINDAGGTIGNNVAVCPDGSIYAFWLDWAARKLFVDRSTNGGATWGTDHLVTNYRINTTPFFISIPPQPQRGVLPMPFSTCAPAGGVHPGRLYVSYFDKSPATADTDAYLRFSDDGGVTWSAEVEVDDEATQAYQFHTNVSVQPDGTVGYSFYDTRRDATSKKTDRFIAFSTDGGATFGANQRMTTKQSDESGNGDPNDYGDYQNMDKGPAVGFWSVWTDSRPGTMVEDVFGAPARP